MKLLKDERGSALILAILMIGLLAVIGISSTQTTTVETRIAGNERLHKAAFYEADGGAELAIGLLEQGIEERGFAEYVVGTTCTVGDVGVVPAQITFYMNTLAAVGTDAPCDSDSACGSCPACAPPPVATPSTLPPRRARRLTRRVRALLRTTGAPRSRASRWAATRSFPPAAPFR